MAYQQTTDNIKVEVEPQFLSKETNGEMEFYVYAYIVSIENMSDEPVRLLSRHWIIRNGQGLEEHVVGEGVVGKQPMIEPGKHYSYRSGCPLTTPTGNMRGKYRMETKSGKTLDVKIPLFFLRPNKPLDSLSHDMTAQEHHPSL